MLLLSQPTIEIENVSNEKHSHHTRALDRNRFVSNDAELIPLSLPSCPLYHPPHRPHHHPCLPHPQPQHPPEK